MACAICKTRREKRHCPGIEGEICTLCCGTQREETIACPLDCEYLQLAHEHETVEKDPAGMPNRDVVIPEEFLDENVEVITALENTILMVALERDAIDSDVREALDGLVRTYQTLGSGLYYESRPSNPLAAAIFDAIQRRVARVRQLESEHGLHKLRDSQVLTMLVFLQHLEFAFDNDRKRGRAFISSLYDNLSEVADQLEPDPSPLIVS